MSIFGSIMSKVLGRKDVKPAPQGQAQAASAPPQPAPQAQSSQAQSSQAQAAPAWTPSAPVDVEKVVGELAAQKGQALDWCRSIVDLLKVLDIDSSLAARKELAQELGYIGDTNDSATMNIWLHKEVMRQLAANGGEVPAALKD